MTAKIKLNAASGGGSFSLQAPSSSSNNRVFTLPDVADATMATVNGITMADSWRITSAYTMTGNNLIQQLTANWERSDTAAFTGIGSPMTESNGNFNFPQTGIYRVQFHMQLIASVSAITVVGAFIRFKKGASGSFTTQAQSQESGGANYYGSATAEAIVDVTDTTNDQVAFVVQGSASRIILANTDYARTGVTFIRLGDT